MVHRTSHDMKPGDRIQVCNTTSKGSRVEVASDGGLKVEAELHPGATLKIVVGDELLTINIHDIDPEYDGPNIIQQIRE